MIYTTNALESVNAQLRKIIKTRGHFPDRRGRDETDLARAAQHHRDVGRGAPHYWKLAMNQFAILYEDRFTAPGRRRMPDDAHGRCRPRGRQERAHRDLENRTGRGFPQRPHASIVVVEGNDTTNASHTKFLTLPVGSDSPYAAIRSHPSAMSALFIRRDGLCRAPNGPSSADLQLL